MKPQLIWLLIALGCVLGGYEVTLYNQQAEAAKTFHEAAEGFKSCLKREHYANHCLPEKYLLDLSKKEVDR